MIVFNAEKLSAHALSLSVVVFSPNLVILRMLDCLDSSVLTMLYTVRRGRNSFVNSGFLCHITPSLACDSLAFKAHLSNN